MTVASRGGLTLTLHFFLAGEFWPFDLQDRISTVRLT